MQHFILRCKHCQKEYTYCTYGNGPEYGTEAGCSMEYCAECQKAFDDAFANIKVKFEPRYVEIQPTFGLDAILENIKKEQQKDTSFPPVIAYRNSDNGYENVEEYTHKGKTFHVEYDDGGKKHYFILVEYDIENKKFNVNKPWRAENNRDTYVFYKSLHRQTEKLIDFLHASTINSEYMSPPLGEVFFMDWDIKTDHSKNAEVKQVKPHIKDKWNSQENCTGIKLRLIHGWGENRVVLAKGIKEKDILDFIDYNVTFEQYQDENKVTITSIVAC